MAGSRRESIGNILQRLQGLLRSGALKEEDRPIWYDVVKTFPPKPTPPSRPVQKILYPEDFVRMHFKKTFSIKGLMDLSDKKNKTVHERFVDKYMEIHSKKEVPNSEIFDKTIMAVKEQGYRLVTQEESAAFEKTRTEKLRREKKSERPSSSRTGRIEDTFNIDDLFSVK